jgi:hypothetical protein
MLLSREGRSWVESRTQLMHLHTSRPPMPTSASNSRGPSPPLGSPPTGPLDQQGLALASTGSSPTSPNGESSAWFSCPQRSRSSVGLAMAEEPRASQHPFGKLLQPSVEGEVPQQVVAAGLKRFMGPCLGHSLTDMVRGTAKKAPQPAPSAAEDAEN